MGSGFDKNDGVFRRNEEEPVEVEDLPLGESVVGVPEGDVEFES